ncbi:vascular endothelial growth factor receptor 1 isoform X2 [Daphnia magna]|nr:vascular endothelial growth factor receptor 1 isoform X2 [Daphnia magna]
MIPDTEWQVIEPGSSLTLTCISKERISSWWLPGNFNNKRRFNSIRVRKTFDKNETHFFSTLTLRNATTADMGSYGCTLLKRSWDRTIRKQYVYVSTDRDLVFLDRNSWSINYGFHLGVLILDVPQHRPGVIPCLPTHPNVTISLVHQPNIINDPEFEKKNITISIPNSRWSFDPERGLTLNNSKLSDNGEYFCVASKGNVTRRKMFAINVMGIELERMGDPSDPREGENVTLVCSYIGKSSASLDWFFPNSSTGKMQIINENNHPKGFEIATHSRSTGRFYVGFHTQSYLRIVGIHLNTPSAFQCQSKFRGYFKSISFRILEAISDPVDNLVTIEKNAAQNLTCRRPPISDHIRWLKDGQSFDSDQILLTRNFSIVPLKGAREEIGTYTCQWENSIGEVKHRNFTVVFNDTATENMDKTIIPLSVILPVLFLIGVGIGIKLCLDRKKKSFVVAEELMRGKTNEINEDIPKEYQIEYLPYDRQWEFPRHRLKLGDQLGVGCFGRVVKAEAVGLKDSDETVKTVAVKMVRSATNDAEMEALIRELKILIYLGSHFNVVNLLGACTKRASRGELLIIIDYCRFGNLQTYLMNNRDNFINQVDKYGQLNSEKLKEAKNEMKVQSTNLPDCTLSDKNKTARTSISFKSISDRLYPSPPFSQQQQDPNSISISTRDLISWSYQIVRGMDYLASKKVIHGDLAARNILLADNGVVKVSDFGMAKKMYYKSNYVKKGQYLMPVKWMAIETLTDNIFSTQSDVWSYGVLLWELFSLGEVPYPGMDVAHVLVKEIRKGYRMEKPDFAPSFFGKIMADCWKTKRNERPTFGQLDELIVGQLESSVTSSYLNMNNQCGKLDEENGTPTNHNVLVESVDRDSMA